MVLRSTLKSAVLQIAHRTLFSLDSTCSAVRTTIPIRSCVGLACGPPSHQLMVCCRAGMGRSVSMVIAYLCCVKGMSYVDAVQLLKARRPGATPLPGLERTIKKVQQLRQARASQSHGHPQADEAGRNRAEGPDSR